ncbi:NAD(P)/FAD-dependent oxidoreductase [Rossellomorea marisflavi]|uniref:NAD(P)/FAD-dependent oxidoreductase n=1 Tax=Rossellomorea marisflavi TaxID=189381 RepID=UPI003D2EB4EE
MKQYDCTIIGGGPAGLNAALVLGRARRNILLVDEGKPRNRVTHHSHGFLTRDGISPQEFRSIAQKEVLQYPTVQHLPDQVINSQATEGGFRLETAEGGSIFTKKIILSTGLTGNLPSIQNIEHFYGKSLFVCPFCDGWELSDRPLVILGKGQRAFHLAKMVYNWSRDLVICSNGEPELSEAQLSILSNRDIPVYGQPIKELRGLDGDLSSVEFTDGQRLKRTGGFVDISWTHASTLHLSLGCETDDTGAVRTDASGQTTVPGIFAAGDTALFAPSQLIIAAGEGSKAAMGVVKDLVDEEFQYK